MTYEEMTDVLTTVFSTLENLPCYDLERLSETILNALTADQKTTYVLDGDSQNGVKWTLQIHFQKI